MPGAHLVRLDPAVWAEVFFARAKAIAGGAGQVVVGTARRAPHHLLTVLAQVQASAQALHPGPLRKVGQVFDALLFLVFLGQPVLLRVTGTRLWAGTPTVGEGGPLS